MKNNRPRDLQPITLPEPVFDGCVTVFEALKMRRTPLALLGENEALNGECLRSLRSEEQCTQMDAPPYDAHHPPD